LNETSASVIPTIQNMSLSFSMILKSLLSGCIIEILGDRTCRFPGL